MPTSFLSLVLSSCTNPVATFAKKKKEKEKKSCIENCLFLMVVMPLMLTLLWCECTRFADVQKWGRGNLG